MNHSTTGNNCLRKFRWVLLVLFVIFSNQLIAQVHADTTKLSKPGVTDTLKKETSVKKRRTPKDPNKALFRAAVVPGLGQIYNKRYWKLPIVYGGFVGLGYAINFNHNYYTEFLNEYIVRTDNDPNTIGNPDYAGASNEQIISVKDYYKRNRDICIIGSVALYAAQIIDAYVDAELSNFDVSDDLSLKISPSVNQSLAFNKLTFTPGISLRFTLKK